MSRKPGGWHRPIWALTFVPRQLRPEATLQTYHPLMDAIDARHVIPTDRLAARVERSLVLDGVINQAWGCLQAGGSTSHTAAAGLCALSLDHGRALRVILQAVPPSAIVLLRPQYETLVRAVWARHCASDADLDRLFAQLTTEGEEAARKLPGIPDMLKGIGREGPRGAQALLGRARDRLMNGLNSYVHGGIHPFRRGIDGYPEKLLDDVMKNSNAMSMLTLLVLAELTGDPAIVELTQELHLEFSDVLPELEPFAID